MEFISRWFGSSISESKVKQDISWAFPSPSNDENSRMRSSSFPLHRSFSHANIQSLWPVKTPLFATVHDTSSRMLPKTGPHDLSNSISCSPQVFHVRRNVETQYDEHTCKCSSLSNSRQLLYCDKNIYSLSHIAYKLYLEPIKTFLSQTYYQSAKFHSSRISLYKRSIGQQLLVQAVLSG